MQKMPQAVQVHDWALLHGRVALEGLDFLALRAFGVFAIGRVTDAQGRQLDAVRCSWPVAWCQPT
jgi:hypothetical protein